MPTLFGSQPSILDKLNDMKKKIHFSQVSTQDFTTSTLMTWSVTVGLHQP